MTGVVPVIPRFKFTLASGDPAALGWLTVYEAGTSTLTNSWQDKNQTTLNTNPIHLDANGECLLWLDSSKTYKLLLQDSNLATVSGWPVDNIPGSANFTSLNATLADAIADVQAEQATAVTAVQTAQATAEASIAAMGSAPLNYTGVVFGWNQDAGLDSARFCAFEEVGPGKLWVAYSSRHVSKNDGEIGMRLEVAEVTYSDSAETVTVGTPTVVASPATFTSGTGAVWSAGFHVIPSGAYAGRKIILAQELNSPDGTYSHIDSRYDTVLYYTDAITVAGPWTRVLLLSGQNAHTSFGLVDYNAAAAGLNIPSGNSIVRMDSGRLVLAGFLAASGSTYFGSMYCDNADGITGWTCGTPIAYTTADRNEPALCLTATGIAAYVRRESGNSRTIYTSTTGATWTLSREATDVPIRNVNACALRTSDGQTLVGGATSTSIPVLGGIADNRRGWKLYPSDNDGAIFGDGVALFEEPQRIGYSCLKQLSNGTYALLFEVCAGQANGNSFNVKASLGLARFNQAVIEGVQAATQPLHDALRFTAADEYSAYSTYVTGDGGTIQDATRTLAAITSAINGNYYSKLALAVSASWGHKGLGTASPVLYSLNRIKNSGASVAGGNITLDTATYAGIPVAVFPTGSELQFAGMVIHGGDNWGAVVKDKAADTSGGNGIGLKWTITGLHYVFAGGTAHINGTSVITGSPIYAGSSTRALHYHFDMKERVAFSGYDGNDLQSIYYFSKASTNGQSATMTLVPIGGTNRHVPEAWFFNTVGLTTAMVRQCSTDVDART